MCVVHVWILGFFKISVGCVYLYIVSKANICIYLQVYLYVAHAADAEEEGKQRISSLFPEALQLVLVKR